MIFASRMGVCRLQDLLRPDCWPNPSRRTNLPRIKPERKGQSKHTVDRLNPQRA